MVDMCLSDRRDTFFKTGVDEENSGTWLKF